MPSNTNTVTHADILGKGRLVQPRPVPHGYQVEQWEKHSEAMERSQNNHPTLDHDSFMEGWNAAFREIYK